MLASEAASTKYIKSQMGQLMDSERESDEEITRLSSPIRTQGDGMEYDIPPKTETLQKQPKSSLGNKLIYRPSDFNYTATQPPVIVGKMVSLVPKQAEQTRRNKYSGSMKDPRFVPYEPYKAAVNPLVPYEKTKSERKAKKAEIAEVTAGLENVSVNETNVVLATQWEVERKALNDELNLLKQDKSKLEGELKFHAQVNCDLKTLLVAAVGEDLEARVQLLTEDKLQLARALLSSAAVVTTHEERTEHLAGQCEVWRSKFLATSLMLEDLAHRKAALVEHAAQLEDVTSKLLDERTAVWNHLTNTFRLLSALQDSKLTPAEGLLGLASTNQELSRALRGQLLGDKRVIEPSVDHLSPDSATVHAARKLLGGVIGLSTQDAACNAVIAIATKRPACCPHCTGEVFTV